MTNTLFWLGYALAVIITIYYYIKFARTFKALSDERLVLTQYKNELERENFDLATQNKLLNLRLDLVKESNQNLLETVEHNIAHKIILALFQDPTRKPITLLSKLKKLYDFELIVDKQTNEITVTYHYLPKKIQVVDVLKAK